MELTGSGAERSTKQTEADIALGKDFRERLTILLEELDAAGERLAAIHVEQAIATLAD